LTTGLILGISLGALLGFVFFDWGIVRVGDRTGTTILFTILGAVVGAVFGAIISVVFKRHRVAVEKLRSATEKYSFGLKELETLSHGYSARIRRAVRTLRDQT